MLPVISSYGQYSSENYGVNTLQVDLGDLVLYYSYQTIVGYRDSKDGRVISKNNWSVTTGKHLNWLEPDKKARIEYTKFQEMLKAALARHIK